MFYIDRDIFNPWQFKSS